ncbi:fructokinase-like 1, chloroplastic [Selaginella moellendorffii]|nr:fructokinase-like 1, chloroplastic [Selaginella moellendorffii]|eukprot:XP_002973268.2 fructokinase-like 1, chloroplastic [Selaginella moellendorffii]
MAVGAPPFVYAGNVSCALLGRCRFQRNHGARAMVEQPDAAPEEKKPRKKNAAKKLASEGSGAPRRKKSSSSSSEVASSSVSRRRNPLTGSGNGQDEDSLIQEGKEDRFLSSSGAVEVEVEAAEFEDPEEVEKRKSFFRNPARRLWKKQFPWLGREFEETFVKPRNEPNPLVCCFGEAYKDFIPSVRVCVKQMDEDAYSTWKGLQWMPPEFARSPGTSPANVAISIARLAGKAAFIGKLGNDDLGKELLETLRENKVETKGVIVDQLRSSSLSRWKIERLGKRKLSMQCLRESAENNLDMSEVNMDILKEAKLFHFSSISLTTEKMCSTLMSAIDAARGFGSLIFFDVNFPLPFWISRDATWEAIEKAWTSSDIIKINKVELEFLIEDEGLAMRLLAKDSIASSWEEFQARKNQRFEYHYTLEQIAPIWRDNIKILFVTDGTYRIHYYTPKFHGDVVGTEDVIVSAFSCDRTGSGDTISAAIIRKLVAQPDIFEDQDRLERALRFVVAAGVISQWTIGAVRGLPTESAAQNLTEQMFPLTQI